jgi:hypothetical protein
MNFFYTKSEHKKNELLFDQIITLNSLDRIISHKWK